MRLRVRSEADRFVLPQETPEEIRERRTNISKEYCQMMERRDVLISREYELSGSEKEELNTLKLETAFMLAKHFGEKATQQEVMVT